MDHVPVMGFYTYYRWHATVAIFTKKDQSDMCYIKILMGGAGMTLVWNQILHVENEGKLTN